MDAGQRHPYHAQVAALFFPRHSLEQQNPTMVYIAVALND
jgi:hypothetical protein